MSQNDSPAFIRVEDAFINLASISYVEHNEFGNADITLNSTDDKGKPKTFVVTSLQAEAVLEFLKKYTVMSTGR